MLIGCSIEKTNTDSTEWVIEPKACPMYIYATNTPIQITTNTIYIYSDSVKILVVSSCDLDFLQQYMDDIYFWTWAIPNTGMINFYRNGQWFLSTQAITYENL